MATNVILPALGMAQDTGKIVEWLKAEGQHVTAGEPLVVIETDKAAVDLEAPVTGILSHVSARAGDEVPVAQVIAVILSPEEAENATQAGPAPRPTSSVAPAVAPAAQQNGASSIVPPPSMAPPTSATSSANGRRLASPKARRIAAARGVDISALHGTGPGGVVVAADVLEAPAPSGQPIASSVSPATHLPPVPMAALSTHSQGDSSISATWRLMAERTTQSWTSIPHFFLVREVAAVQLVAWRARAQARSAEKLTYTDLLVKIVAEALRRYPRVNSSWRDGSIVANDDVNVGIAVATDDGLVVPVIHQAGDLTLSGIARRRADLAARAQQGRLRLDDLRDGTFTISNLGMYGVDAFNAIINAPQAAILAVGRMSERVVPVGGVPAVQQMMTLSLSCDHRVVDGARGAQFLAAVAGFIEDPSTLPD